MWLKVDGEAIYFNVDSKLMKMDIDGNHVEVILSDIVMESINLVDGILYYMDFAPQDGRGSIWSYDILSKQKLCIKGNIDGLYSILIYDGWVYYVERNSIDDSLDTISTIIKIKLDGSELTEVYSIDQNIHSMNIYMNTMFFVRGDTEYYEVISSIYLDQLTTEKVLPFNTTYRFEINEFTKCLDEMSYDSPINLNIAGNWIFYENVYGHNAYLQVIDFK
jgi:hypothetical protein